MQNLRISLRGLLRAPMMTLTIVATVGLGVGATTTIFISLAGLTLLLSCVGLFGQLSYEVAQRTKEIWIRMG